MTAMAARALGYHLYVLDPDPSCAARFVVEGCLTGSFDDVEKAKELASRCQVVTLEIEKLGLPAVQAVEAVVPVRPGSEVLSVIQDRITQRQWLVNHGFPVGPFRVASSEEELAAAAHALLPAPAGALFVKSARGGYDGRGQGKLVAGHEAASLWAALGKAPVVAERGLNLRQELSVLVARSPTGETVVYPPALNHHVEGVLAWSVLPGPIEPGVAAEAMKLAEALAHQLKVEGLLVTEFFLTTDGELYVNELAPRPHNSFHTTEVSCVTSQFEQHVRAVCALPLGSPDVVRPGAIVNLLGDLWSNGREPAFERALALNGVGLHLYGKRAARPGRKMGHLSAVAATPEAALAQVQAAYARLSLEDRT
jgi:5-(carboxyamino)imidazole ribonucleotide synthase